jgi:hypothetical protein
VENIRIPFHGNFHRFYYAHLTMCDVTTHPMILEDIRRTRIMFGSEQLVFGKAISYRPSRRQLETARSSTSYSSNDSYVCSDPDYYEFGTFKQDETRSRSDVTRVRQKDKVTSTNGPFIRSFASKRPREDDEVQIVDIKSEIEQHEMYNAIQQEYDELNFKNKMLKQEIEHAEYKLDNLRAKI